MIALEDCIGLCGLTEEEVLAVAEHEHLPKVLAASFAGHLLCQDNGAEKIRDMIVDSIKQAQLQGSGGRALVLSHVLRKFLLAHPKAGLQ